MLGLEGLDTPARPRLEGLFFFCAGCLQLEILLEVLDVCGWKRRALSDAPPLSVGGVRCPLFFSDLGAFLLIARPIGGVTCLSGK